MTSYLPDQMLRNMTSQPVTAAQQQEVDEYLGSAVAAASRRARRISRSAQGWVRSAAHTSRSRVFFSKNEQLR